VDGPATKTPDVRQYIVSRLLLAIPTVVGITLLTFFGLRVFLPASVVDQIVGEYGRNDPGLKLELEKQLGLNASVPTQYVRWIGQLARGNLGTSLISGRSVKSELRNRIPISFELGLVGFLSSILVAVPVGIISAVRQDQWPDYVLRSIAILLNALPGFWIALLIITFGSIWFN